MTLDTPRGERAALLTNSRAGGRGWQGGVRPVIDRDLCSGGALCREACLVDPTAIDITVLGGP